MAENTMSAPGVSSVAGTRAGIWGQLLRHPMGASSLGVLATIVILGVLEPLLATHDPEFISLSNINAPAGTPGWPLGGDGAGHDVWARLLASINVSLTSALIGTAVAMVLGVSIGLVSGYLSKTTDIITSWVFDLLMALPTLVMLIVIAPVIGGDYKVTMAILGVFLSPGVFRLVRNLVVGVRNELYVDAARVSGLSDLRILSRHVFYVIRGPIIIQAAFLATVCINMQAGLAFIGIGARTPSFGSMISQAFQTMYSQPIQLVWPTIGLSLLTGALVLFGNAYRDVLGQRGTRKGRSARKERTAKGDATVRTVPSSTGTGSSDLLLRVQDLSVSYVTEKGVEIPVVHDVSLEVRPGEIVGLVGESGSGKSQTAFSVLGLLPKNAAVNATALTYNGISLLDDSKEARKLRREDIAYVPQEPMSNLDPSFTIGAQLTEGLRRAMPRSEAKATVLELLGKVGIPDPERTFKSYPHQVSGGMAQRALIAGAIASRPKLLIADEPTTALDVTVQAEILDLLRELRRELNMGVLIVTHNFGVVADLCDRVVVMRKGETVEAGAVRDIFHSPSHPYTRQLISAILDEQTVRSDQPILLGQGE
ncbi:ATP-binding cassette domain-containing protein [Paenarthrobacter sp. NPDC057981]|uniref:ATP-binding cassette domain-containing protein n=1 Tax=Paenarthrobacter sp. NPDC057981 TaxID=3346297 RepID=UPI0036D98E73